MSTSKDKICLEKSNTQRTWLVPTKCKLHWVIEDVFKLAKMKSPKISGPAQTSFTVFLRVEDCKSYAEMKCFSAGAPLTIKGAISFNNAECFPIKRKIKKGGDVIKLTVNPVDIFNKTLEINLEFISFPLKNQFLKVNKNAAQLGETLKDLIGTKGDATTAFLTDCSLNQSQELLCHKAILSSRSLELDSWLEESYPSPMPILRGYGNSVLQGLLDYLYKANPYYIIKNFSLSEVKEISKLGKKLGVSEMDCLFEERDFKVTSKVHNCCTVFEVMITNNDYFALETDSCYEFPNFYFCKSEWKMELIKRRNSSENEQYMIILNKPAKNAASNINVKMFYKDLKENWNALEEVEDFKMTIDIKPCVKKEGSSKKIKSSKGKNTKNSNNEKTCFAFFIEKEFLEALFKCPIVSNAQKFDKLVLKCKMKHTDLHDNVNMKVKTFDAFRFLYDRLHFNSLLPDLKKLYDGKKYTDLTLRVRSEFHLLYFRVHKIILAARSSIFKQKINESKDGIIKIEVNMVLFKNFEQIVRFLYTNDIDFEIISPLESYKFAYKNSIVDLMYAARDYLHNHYLDESKADDIMQAAVQCNDELFKEDLKVYMNKHHAKRWKPDTSEFISKPKMGIDEKSCATNDTDTEGFISEASEISEDTPNETRMQPTETEATVMET